MCAGDPSSSPAASSVLGTISGVHPWALGHGAPGAAPVITLLCLSSSENVGPHFPLSNYICSVLLPNQVTFKGTGVETSYVSWEETQFTPQETWKALAGSSWLSV